MAAGYSLTVQMRAEARDLLSGLRAASREARQLADRTRSAQRALGRLDGAGARVARELNAVGASSRRAATGLGRLTSRAGVARSRLRSVGDDGVRSMRRLDRALATAGRGASPLGGLAAGGAFALSAGQVMQEGNRYQRQMNTFRAVTGATAAQMKRAAFMAQQLGSDLQLPSATAADAAEAMVELSKAGFRTDQSIDATRASLELASAAGVDAADSAKYLGDIMDQFGMGADQAARAADVLAATANSASGGITDIYYAMRYAGPVAHGLGVSMEDAASAIGMLGKAGILGHKAGTTLRGMMANLAAPTPKMIAALHRLGIEAWDAKGSFKGLRTVIDGLTEGAAHHVAAGRSPLRSRRRSVSRPCPAPSPWPTRARRASTPSRLAVRRTGAAADITASRGEGLSGAMLQLKTQARQTGLALYEGMAPGLEGLARLTAGGLADVTPYLTEALKYGRELATLYGPELKAKADQGLGALVKEAKQLLGPLKALGEDTLAAGLNLLINAAQGLGEVVGNLAGGLEPVARALADLGSGSDGAAGTLDILVYAANLAIDAVAGLSAVLQPIGHAVATLVDAFGALPGPIQSAALALLLFRRARPGLTRLAGTVTGPVRGAFRSFAQQMRVQQHLAASAGQSLSRYGAAWATLQSRVGFLGHMTTAFRSANGAGVTFMGTLSGVGRAARTGLRRAMGGLLGALGGPWGAALAGVTIGLGLLAQHQREAARAAAEHQRRISSLTSALKESGGVIDANVRAQAAQILIDTKVRDGKAQLVNVMEKAGVSMSQLTDAYLGQGTSLGALQKQLNITAEANVQWIATQGGATKAYNETGLKAKIAATALGSVKGEMADSVKNAKSLAAAQQSAGGGTSAYDRLKTAVGGLADETANADQRTRSLKKALDLLSGGQISMQAARAQVNSAVLNLKDSVKAGVDRGQGYGGKQLLNSNNTLNTATRNGQQLYTQLTALADAAADASVSAYSLAKRNGKDLPEALAKARGEMCRARKAAVEAAHGYGLTDKEAKAVADSLGLLPSKVSLLLQTQGMDSTLADLLAVQAEFDRLPNHKTIKVDSLSEGAQKKLKSLGFTVKTVPGTRQIKISAPTGRARSSLDALIATMGHVSGSKHVHVSAATASAIHSLQAVQRAIRATPGAKTVTMRAPTTAARAQLVRLGFQIHKVPGSKKVRITVPTGGAKKAVSSLQAKINALRGKTVNIFTATQPKPTSWDRDANGIPDTIQAPRNHADGAVVDYYARGGVRSFADGPRREQHVAQIAPAGAWRVWAEPETGGEAYVPLAPQKRKRSKGIVEEVVGRFDGAVTWFADGGTTPRTGTRGGAVSTISEVARRASATATLADIVRRFTVRPAPTDARSAAATRIVDARAGRGVQVVVVREQQPLVGSMPVTVHDSGATPEQIGSEMMRQLRNAQRGGRIS